jgi:hypothetical protein
MSFLSRIRTQILFWWQDTPLPAGTSASFQSWHEFDDVANRWRAVAETATSPPPPNDNRDNPSRSHQEATATDDDGSYTLNLVTWNVDYSSPHPAHRLSAILAHILSLSFTVDIIFCRRSAARPLRACCRSQRCAGLGC